jgi:3-oxoacyl-[acyl-carrier-protein] synthase-3
MLYSKIISTGSYLPKKILTNDDLSKIVDTNDEWITQRTGIKTRHIAAENEFASDMGVQACFDALKNANLSVNDIDLLIVATSTSDAVYPSCACRMQEKLKMFHGAPAFDVQAVCSGFLYALDIADSMIKTGRFKRAMVVGSDKNSSIVDWSDRNTCVLFGDGAGAVVLEKIETSQLSNDTSFSHIIDSQIFASGEFADLLVTKKKEETQKQVIEMNGREVFRHATTKMSDSIKNILDKNKIKPEDVALFIPHQANYRILIKVAENLGIDADKFIMTLDKQGNTSSATIPLALDFAIQNNKIKRGDILVFTSLGSGLTWGSSVVVF